MHSKRGSHARAFAYASRESSRGVATMVNRLSFLVHPQWRSQLALSLALLGTGCSGSGGAAPHKETRDGAVSSAGDGDGATSGASMDAGMRDAGIRDPGKLDAGSSVPTEAEAPALSKVIQGLFDKGCYF